MKECELKIKSGDTFGLLGLNVDHFNLHRSEQIGRILKMLWGYVLLYFHNDILDHFSLLIIKAAAVFIKNFLHVHLLLIAALFYLHVIQI